MHSEWPTTRRGLLRAGLAGPAAIAAAAVSGCSVRSRPDSLSGSQRAAISPAGEEILRAVIPAVLGPLHARDAASTQALEAGLDSLDDYLAHLSLALQEEANDAFAMLDLLPVRVLLLGSWQRWQDAPAQSVEDFLRTARESRFATLRRIYSFLQSMAVVAWFDQPLAWHEVGYPGPPVGPQTGSGRR